MPRASQVRKIADALCRWYTASMAQRTNPRRCSRHVARRVFLSSSIRRPPALAKRAITHRRAGPIGVALDLTPKQRRALRALAHHLDPVVQVGVGGVTPALVAKVEAELENHELIKVKVSKDSPVGTEAAAAIVIDGTNARLAQIIGRTLVLYRARKEKPAIKLPPGSDT